MPSLWYGTTCAWRQRVLLSLWRNALLLIIGILHFLLWEGDVLTVYAVASAVLIALRKLRNQALISVGVFVFALSVPCALLAQYVADATGSPLHGLWTQGETPNDGFIDLSSCGAISCARWG